MLLKCTSCKCVQVDPTMIADLLPSLMSLDVDWLGTVLPALNQIDPNYLVAVVKAVAPHLVELSPDTIVQLIPALSSLGVGTWENMIELLNNITPAQVRRLVLSLSLIRQGGRGSAIELAWWWVETTTNTARICIVLVQSDSYNYLSVGVVLMTQHKAPLQPLACRSL